MNPDGKTFGKNPTYALRRQPLAPLGAAACQNFTTVFGFHARTKTMRALASQIAWLVRAFHAGRRLQTDS